MTTKIDTSKFETPDDFTQALMAIPIPSDPYIPEEFIQEKSFESKADYYAALAESYKIYDIEKEKYDILQIEYAKKETELFKAFKKFCINQPDYKVLPDDIKKNIYDKAYIKGRNNHFSGIYIEMQDYADIAKESYLAGQNKI
jgi:hypothetical protein